MLKSLSSSLILRGILAVIVGIVAVAWPQVTVFALVIVFGVYAFVAAGLEAMRAFRSDSGGPVIGHLLLGLIDVGAGMVALAWPGLTALALTLIVAIWAIVGGLTEFGLGFKPTSKLGHVRPSSSAVWFTSLRGGALRPTGNGGDHARVAVRTVQPGDWHVDAHRWTRVAPHPHDASLNGSRGQGQGGLRPTAAGGAVSKSDPVRPPPTPGSSSSGYGRRPAASGDSCRCVGTSLLHPSRGPGARNRANDQLRPTIRSTGRGAS